MKYCNDIHIKHLLVMLVGFAISIVVHASDDRHLDHATLMQVKSLYGLDDDGAIRRLAAESEAADIYRRVEGFKLEGYAGAWFDGDTLRLHVALVSPEYSNLVSRLGAIPITATWSLKELEEVQARITDERTSPHVADAWRSAFVDYEHNKVIIGVVPGRVDEARSLLLEYAGKIEVREDHDDVHPTADVRGGDGTWNYSWYLEYDGGIWKCSIGASVENGYYTAGHCGGDAQSIGGADIIKSAINYMPSDPVLGVVVDSTIPFQAGGGYSNKDTAWIETSPGWVPTSKINGYSDGVFNVPAKWSGTSQYPKGTTVCRYGKTSGGPHCGEIASVGTSFTQSNVKFVNMIFVNGSCASPGDSGGPLVAAGSDKQLQGTLYGGINGIHCPSSSLTRYQAITDHIDEYENDAGSLLTAHGPNAPTITPLLRCPNMADSGMGTFTCSYDHYNSQGVTSVSWSGSHVLWSGDDMAFGNCGALETVTVTLTITNPYGSFVRNRSFSCPMGPIP